MVNPSHNRVFNQHVFQRHDYVVWIEREQLGLVIALDRVSHKPAAETRVWVRYESETLAQSPEELRPATVDEITACSLQLVTQCDDPWSIGDVAILAGNVCQVIEVRDSGLMLVSPQKSRPLYYSWSLLSQLDCIKICQSESPLPS